MNCLFPLTQRGFEYGNKVLAGEIPVCELTRLAVERWARDFEKFNSEDPEWLYRFDPAESERWLSFLARLPHVKGKWARRRELFDPSPWQCFVTMNLYGWLGIESGLRRFRSAYVEVPRKQGKSFWFGGLGNGHLCIDDEPGAEVYCGATTEKQAWALYSQARMMMLRSDDVANEFGVEVNAKSLWIMEENSKFVPIIGNPGDGDSPSCAIVDELHEHKTSNMISTMESGMGARDQPMLLQITTAGSDFGGPCREIRSDCIRILNQTESDETVFAIIYTIDDDDDWTAIDSIVKANPNLGVSVSREFLLSELSKAKRNPAKQITFKTKYLNMWVGAKAAWINMLELQRCQKKIKLTDKYHGRRCFIGLDLASKYDIAAMALLFPGEDDQIDAFFKFYLPEETVNDSPVDRYRAWKDAGKLIVTDGNVIDYSVIEDDLLEATRLYNVEAVGYDPWQATQMAQRMMDEGIEMVEVRPTVVNFSEPMKELEKRFKSKHWRYNDDIFTWMVGNVVAKVDKKDNIFPDKESVNNKIDGVVAAIMAMNRVLHDDGPSVYESRGLAG